MKQEKDTLVIGCTPTGFVSTLAKEVANNESIIHFGIYWDECEELYSIGLDIIEEMMKQGKIKGPTYTEVMSTEYGPKHIELSNKNFEDIGYEYTKINDEETLKVARKYLEYINKETIDEYDNLICIIEDNPNYSHSGNDFITTTVIVNSKNNDSYIINVGYGEKYDYATEDKIVQKIKS